MKVDLNNALFNGFLYIARYLETRDMQLPGNFLHCHILVIKQVATAQQMGVLWQTHCLMPVDILGR